MRIGSGREGGFGYGDKPPRTPSATPSRALTVIAAPVAHDMPTPLTRGDSAFLAHLIATKGQAPQTRLKRRAEPAEALAAYHAVAKLKF